MRSSRYRATHQAKRTPSTFFDPPSSRSRAGGNIKWLLQTVVVPIAVSVLAQLLAIYVDHWIR